MYESYIAQSGVPMAFTYVLLIYAVCSWNYIHRTIHSWSWVMILPSGTKLLTTVLTLHWSVIIWPTCHKIDRCRWKPSVSIPTRGLRMCQPSMHWLESRLTYTWWRQHSFLCKNNSQSLSSFGFVVALTPKEENSRHFPRCQGLFIYPSRHKSYAIIKAYVTPIAVLVKALMSYSSRLTSGLICVVYPTHLPLSLE